MKSERGAALILALLILSFLAILAGGLLTSTTIDIWVGNNYQAGTQLRYLAEAGIEDARESLRISSSTPSQMLAAGAGGDGVLSSSRDLQTLLGKTDDVAFANGGGRSVGKLLIDLAGRSAGRYYVFLRNDPADGATSLNDTNQILTLLSFGVIGNSTGILETTIVKFRFPKLPAALTLDGTPAVFQPPNSDIFGIGGVDAAGGGGRESAIGVISASDQAVLFDAIPVARQINYPGGARVDPPPADVGLVEDGLDRRLRTPSGLENIVETVLANAADVYNPAWDGETYLGNAGAPAAPRVIAVNGNCTFGPGAGFGMLVVRGNLTIRGSFSWTGLILVIGQGVMRWTSDAGGQVSGGVFLGRTRENDRSSANVLGTRRTVRGPVTAVFDDGGPNAIQLNTADVSLANARFPYTTIAYREY